MAYQTGPSASPVDLMAALAAFIAPHGFVAQTPWTNGAYTIQSFLKNGVYYNFQYNVSELNLSTSLAISGSGLITAQSGALNVLMKIKQIVGPHIGYHYFTDGKAVHCVVEIVTGVFTHFNFGEITKNGNWGGGAFVTGSSIKDGSLSFPAEADLISGYNQYPFMTYSTMGNTGVTSQTGIGHVRSDTNGAGRICPMGWNSIASSPNTDIVYCLAWVSNEGRRLINASPNTYNGRAVIMPITLLQATTAATGPYFQLGHVPNAGVVNMTNINPKDVVNSDWMAFPIGQKNSTAGTVYINSQMYGMAYKK